MGDQKKLRDLLRDAVEVESNPGTDHAAPGMTHSELRRILGRYGAQLLPNAAKKDGGNIHRQTIVGTVILNIPTRVVPSSTEENALGCKALEKISQHASFEHERDPLRLQCANNQLPYDAANGF